MKVFYTRNVHFLVCMLKCVVQVAEKKGEKTTPTVVTETMLGDILGVYIYTSGVRDLFQLFVVVVVVVVVFSLSASEV